ncbi:MULTISPECIES: RNA polymerase sigma factor [Sphingobacterium]|uniref:RNA polymerase sigma factor n=1 Tax=Sphingobacterium TaxID=28453 RepID=UPI0013D96BF6|nr:MULTISPECIES: RNA polymerase sigma-70 factor [unclassified Sphingobacterium]
MFSRNSFSSDLEEREQLVLLKKGNYAAFDALYTEYSPRILGRLIRLLGHEDTAEELLQDLFLRVWDKKSQIDIDQSFKGYLFTIAQNLVYDYFRKQSLDERYRAEFVKTYSEFYGHIEEDMVFKQTEERLMSSIEKLPPQCKQVYILFKLEGKSYAEISALLGISKSTINNHLTKANAILKKEFPFLFFWITVALFNFLK